MMEVQLDRLDHLLRSAAAPPSCMDMSELDGLLTGIAVGPQPIPASEWLPVALGTSLRLAVTSKQALELVSAIELRYATILNIVQINPESLQPVLWKGPNGAIVASGWAEGFMEAVQLRLDAWHPILEGAERSYLIMPMLSLCRDTTGQTLVGLEMAEDKGTLNQLARMLPAAVQGIYDFWRGRSVVTSPLFPVATIRRTARPGRNEPCSCGSGKKYKRCCEGRPVVPENVLKSESGLSLHRVGSGVSEARPFDLPPAPEAVAQPRVRWIGKGETIEVQGIRIAHGMLYLGSTQLTTAASLIQALGIAGVTTATQLGEEKSDPGLIDPALRVRLDEKGQDEALPYEPSYRKLSPRQRGRYLRWLAGGAQDSIAVEYVRMYLLGLERRLLLDALDNPAESQTLLAEVDRLLTRYGLYDYRLAPFAGLKEYVQARQWPQDMSPEALHPSQWDREDWPFAFRYGLGIFARDRRPLPAAWALRMALSDRNIPKRTAALRQPKVFARAFAQAYAELFGEGFLLSRNKARLAANYYAVSPDLRRNHLLFSWDLPDVMAVAGPRKKLTAVVELATARIDAYSRFVNRYPERADSMQAAWLLPVSLWPQAQRERLAGIREQLPPGGEPLSFGEWLARLRPEAASGEPSADVTMTAGTMLSFAGALAQVSVGLEPDVLAGAKKPGATDTVVLFPLASPVQPDRETPAYRKASTHIALLGCVAHAGGDAANAIEGYVKATLREWTHLHPDLCLRLLAQYRMQLRQGVKLSSLKARLAEIAPEQRAGLASSLASAATSGGVLSPARVRVLEQIYRLLQQDEQAVYTHLHSAHDTGQGASPTSKAGHGGRGVALDHARIAQVQQETALVSALLADVFAEEEESPAPPPPKPTAAASPLSGLDAAHALLAVRLMEQDVWTRAEVEAMAAEALLMVDGALERINEAALDLHGEILIEGDDPLYVQIELLERWNDDLHSPA